MTPNYRISRVITPAASLALITLDQAKAALGIDPADTSQDAALTQQIAAVSTAIENWCGRTFARQTYRDQLRFVYNWLGPGEPLVTRQWPVPADALVVTEDGTVLDETTWEINEDSGELYRLEGTTVAPWASSTIILDYDGGYDEIPADVQAAALEWLGARWHTSTNDPGLRSQTIPDVISEVYTDMSSTSSTTGSAMPPIVRDLLAPYQRWLV